jgi:erythromycin esterase
MRFLAGGLMAWLREQNATSGNPLRFVGVDPVSVPPAETALRISDSFLAGVGSGAAAAPARAQLPSARRIR